jgi:hypothetical protein
MSGKSTASAVTHSDTSGSGSRRWLLAFIAASGLMVPSVGISATSLGRFVQAPCRFAECSTASSAFFQIYSSQKFSAPPPSRD